MNIEEKLIELREENEKNKLNISKFNELTDDFSYSNSALLWFQLHLNEVVTSEELAQIHGKNNHKPISHNIRRIFELRDEKGYNIINHKSEGSSLKVDEWMLLEEKPNLDKIKSRGVNKRIRIEIFERDDYTCQVCGLSLGDNDPFNKEQKITLHAGHIKAHKRKNNEEITSHTKLTADDFITMCNVCNEGLKNNDYKKITLLDRVKKASFEEKKEIFNYLKEELN